MRNSVLIDFLSSCRCSSLFPALTVKGMFGLGKKPRFPFMFLFMKSKGANFA